jgi:hypothetical protein
MNKYRTLLRVIEIESNAIQVIVPAWDSERNVCIFSSNIPLNILKNLKIGTRFYGKAELGVENSYDLNISDFELVK